ncbi:hypothetical protein D9756_004111 [Leucocoprinus leucothites]|uniref:BRCT domain-containing protein n=1 Tax=Leucocoprinus leucothites TaxID=201217 RepID=A0A8H5G0L1_9AGAR|nr:hypothetical protein D9756_004111 [Leucoagaricus leucothites]
MSDPPPSSAPPVIQPPFFYHPDGQRILIFVEAGGISHRPRLIRNLKRHDAVICTDPKHAQVILVDPESWQGREFIREWGKDKNKVVLNYTWVTKCINAAKPLLEEDDWGGSKTCDDGLPILRPTANGDEDPLPPRSPLPTPREAPMEASVASSKRRKSTDAHRKRSSIDKPLPRINTTPTPAENSGASSSAYIPSQLPNLTQPPQSQSQSTPILSPTAQDPTSVFAQQQQAPPTMPFGMSSNMMPGFNMPMMPFPPQMLAMFAQQQAAAQSPVSPQPPMVPQIQENFTTALMDIMKMYGAMPGGMSTGQWPMFPGMMAQMQQQMPQSAGSSGSATVVREDSSGASTSRRATESPSLSLPLGPNSPSVLEPSIKRKRKSDVAENDSMDESPEVNSDSDEDGGEDEPPLAALYKRKKRAEERELKQKDRDKDGRKARRTNLQFTAPPRNPHQSSKPTSIGDSSRKLFVHTNGKPMQFFVQVDQNNRQEVTRAIKKNGGAITSQIPGADYAVLYTLSSTFKTLLNEATVTKTPAVTHHFVLDSISEGGIPDSLDNYIFSAKQSQTRRKQFASAAVAEIKRLEKNAKQVERAKREMDMKYNYIARSGTPESDSLPMLASTSSPTSTTKKATSSTPKPSSAKFTNGEQPKAVRSSKPKDRSRTSTPVLTVKKPIYPKVGPSTEGSTSASKGKDKKKSSYYPKESTPPPPTKPQKLAHGYLYTQEEKEWAERYLFILFKRDPHMSQTAVAKALYHKLPHHTPGSWSTFLTGAFKSEYEETKKRGGIAHRKEKSRWETEKEQTKADEGQQAKVQEEKSRDQKGQKVLPEWGQEQEKMKESTRRDEDIENQQEYAEEKEIEDQMMQDVSSPRKIPMEKEGHTQMSPMQVDGTDPAPTEAAGETSKPVQYTQEEEEDIKTIVQFFLAGGDDGESEESVVWARLAEKEGRKSAAEWEEVFSRHDKEITTRFENLLGTKVS